jgi:hypothetical protein
MRADLLKAAGDDLTPMKQPIREIENEEADHPNR